MDEVHNQQTMAKEFEERKDRVFNIIGSANWGENGRYKEILLASYLRSVLPEKVAVGTGFVKNEQNEITKQIDIIIYRKDVGILLQLERDFIILKPESVLGIIEVKSNASGDMLSRKKKQNQLSPIEICEYNGKIIGNKQIFNGIWGYKSNIKVNPHIKAINLGKQLSECSGYLNHICFNSNVFCRYWEKGNPVDRPTDSRPCFSFYDLSWAKIFDQQEKEQPGLAFGYFISNLLECVYGQTALKKLNKEYFEILYPLKKTKEAYRYDDCDIKIDMH